MLALEPFHCTRIVGRNASTESRWSGVAVRVVLSPDELLLVHSAAPGSSTGSDLAGVGDWFGFSLPPHSIMEPESGFSGAWISADEFGAITGSAVEWSVPTGRPAFAQGLIAGVPAKVYFDENEHVFLFCASAYAHELSERLG